MKEIYNISKHDQNQNTSKFNENINSNTLHWDENLEGSNIAFGNQVCQDKHFRRSVNKMPLRNNFEISMKFIEPPNVMTPRKLDLDKSLSNSSWSDYDQRDKISTLNKTQRQADTALKSYKTDNDTPEFKKFRTATKNFGFKSIKSELDAENSSQSVSSNSNKSRNKKKFELIRSSNKATMSAWKAMLRKSKVELVGMLFSSGKLYA